MRRHLLGGISLLLIVIGMIGYSRFGSAGDQSQVAGILFRSGLLLGAIWLAMPQLATLSPWMFGAALLAGVLLLWNAKFVGLLLVGLILASVAYQYAVKRFFSGASGGQGASRSTRSPRSTRSAGPRSTRSTDA